VTVGVVSDGPVKSEDEGVRRGRGVRRLPLQQQASVDEQSSLSSQQSAPPRRHRRQRSTSFDASAHLYSPVLTRQT